MEQRALPARFRTDKGAARFAACYDRLLSHWDCGYRSTVVEGDFGATHLLVSGDVTRPPMVLLSGAQGTAGMWGPFAEALCGRFHLHAPDLIDQVGRSEPRRVLVTAEDAVTWVEQTLDALELDAVHLVGNSLGAYIAACFAVARSGRVRSLSLLAPAATVSPLAARYVLDVMLALALPFSWSKTRFLRRIAAGRANPGDPLFDLLHCAMSDARAVSKLIPRALDPAALRALPMPLLLVLGGRDGVNQRALDPATGIFDGAPGSRRLEVLVEAGHLWTSGDFHRAGEYVLDTLHG